MHNTMFDYLSASNGLQYLMALIFAAGFLVLWEVLMSPRPFRALASAVAEDLLHARRMGLVGFTRLAKRCVAAGALGALYLAALPVMFVQALGMASMRGVAAGASYGWSPVRAYFTGRRGSVRKKDSSKKQ